MLAMLVVYNMFTVPTIINLIKIRNLFYDHVFLSHISIQCPKPKLDANVLLSLWINKVAGDHL